MNEPFFSFGRRLPEYAVPVLNERAVRAGAGLLFFFAMVAFMNAWLLGQFAPTRVFVVFFLIDFSLRLFVNPHWAPSLVLGQWLVRRQQPEWTGAPQKRFAWAMGWLLALTMLWLVVIQQVMGPINLLVCSLCLLLLWFESAFGICLGCWLYNRLRPDQAQLCPGGACAYTPLPQDRIQPRQWLGVALVLLIMALIGPGLAQRGANPRATSVSGALQSPAAPNAPLDPAEAERCKVPEFAKAMGHEEKWKLHNQCP